MKPRVMLLVFVPRALWNWKNEERTDILACALFRAFCPDCMSMRLNINRALHQTYILPTKLSAHRYSRLCVVQSILTRLHVDASTFAEDTLTQINKSMHSTFATKPKREFETPEYAPRVRYPGFVELEERRAHRCSCLCFL